MCSRSAGRWCMTVVVMAGVTLAAQAPAPRYVVQTIAPDVYAVVYNPELEVEGNTLIVVNDTDVLVVDSNAGLTTARLTIGEIRKITPKPVRYVVNTHWHDDHVMGNQAYADAFPGVEFIAHPATRADIVDHAFANNAFVIDLIDADIARFDGYLRTGIGRDGKAMTPEQEERVRIARRTRTEMAGDRRAFRAVPPTIDVADARTLTFGRRTIEIRHPGRGNTRGDLIVYLPKERIVATGDLVVWPIPYATNAYVSEWIETLDRLMQIPAAAIVPGHGPVMTDWSYVKRVQAALQTARGGVERAKRDGQSLEEATKTVALPDQRAAFLDGKDTRALSFEFNFRVGLIRSLWEELDPEIMNIARASAMQRESDGVYAYAPRASNELTSRLATLFVNDKDVVLVTAARTAPVARAIIRATRELTDKPVRFVVNTAGPVSPDVIAAYENTYADADVIGYPNAKRALSIGGAMKLHRGSRVIAVHHQPNGIPTVEVQRLPD